MNKDYSAPRKKEMVILLTFIHVISNLVGLFTSYAAIFFPK